MHHTELSLPRIKKTTKQPLRGPLRRRIVSESRRPNFRGKKRRASWQQLEIRRLGDRDLPPPPASLSLSPPSSSVTGPHRRPSRQITAPNLPCESADGADDRSPALFLSVLTTDPVSASPPFPLSFSLSVISGLFLNWSYKLFHILISFETNSPRGPSLSSFFFTASIFLSFFFCSPKNKKCF